MLIVIGCETSGALRCRFAEQGHQVISVDILPAKDGAWAGRHVQMDLQTFMRDCIDPAEVDLFIFHPTCTYLTISAEWAYKDPDFERYPGVGYHQKVKPGTLVGFERREARLNAAKFCIWGMGLPCKRIAMENPVGALGRYYRKADQTVQPYQFGDDASKATCWWLKGLKPLVIDPSWRKAGRMVEWPRGSGKMVERWANQTDSGQNRLTPSADRWDVRSVTFERHADQVAAQWGGVPVDNSVETGDNSEPAQQTCNSGTKEV